MAAAIRPILKWPGGKFRLLGAIVPELADGRRLVEPFVGSGAVFMNADFPEFLLCDLNADLIEFYQTLAREGEAFIGECRRLFAGKANSAGEFYRRRDHFNMLPPGPERAALFLYFNRHGYNGLTRYNARGRYNVPFGRYAKPLFPEAAMQAFLEKAAQVKLEFAVADFRNTFDQLREGDVVYCDPPYIPLSDTANFTCYSGNAFAMAEQEELAALVEKASGTCAGIVVSNHDNAAARRLYAAATRMRSIAVRRTISCNGERRDMVKELLAVYE